MFIWSFLSQLILFAKQGYINLLDQKEPVFKFQIDEKKNKKVARGKTNYSKKVLHLKLSSPLGLYII